MPSPTAAAVNASNNNTNPNLNLQFPLNRNENESGQWFVMTEYKYFRVTSDNQGKGNATDRIFKLPLPAQLSTNYEADWDVIENGIFGNELLNAMPKMHDAAKDFLSMVGIGESKDASISQAMSSLKDAKGVVSRATNDLMTVAAGFGKATAGGVLDGFTNTNQAQRIGLYAGVARNPFMAVAYRGPNLRSFRFQWELLPTSESESNALRNLIKFLKHGMHPSYRDLSIFTNALFEYPNIYRPAFTKNDYLFDIGFCVIKSVDVDYHPRGKVYHSNKAPFMVSLGLTLQEVEVITKESILGDTGTEDSSGSPASQGGVGR